MSHWHCALENFPCPTHLLAIPVGVELLGQAVPVFFDAIQRKPELRAPAQKMLEAARAARAPESEREILYISALEAAIDGRITQSISHFETIARANPHDLLALRLAQFELFWLGEAAWMRDISERAAPAWSEGDKGLGAYLAIRAFGLEETGDYAQAERCGRSAVEIDPTDPWGAHAVAWRFRA